MKNKSCCCRARQRRATEMRSSLFVAALVVCCAGAYTPAASADAPAWMHALVGAPIPAHDEKTDAVLLYSEDILTVQPNGKIKSLERRAYKILRPDGKDVGWVRLSYDAETKITSIHGWCIPASGKDYEVKEKDSAETALFGVANGELVSDVRTKILQIPAADPGNIVGYEFEREKRPYVLQDEWLVQQPLPTREARYTLQLPPGWEYKAAWLNHEEVKPTSVGSNQWQWVVSDVKGIKAEEQMPPWRGVAGQMLVTILPQGSVGTKGFQSWAEMGTWESNLTKGRRDVSPEIKQKVAELTAGSASTLAKMQALAKFLQQDIRYVAIELGIGGWQPHPAIDTFGHRYGDCKDKATLMSAMLREIDVDSYYFSINTVRGTVTPEMPANMFSFDHEILAIRLPDSMTDPSLLVVIQHPKLGRLLIFDPTDELTPFGQLRGQLQANYGLLVAEETGELLKTPQLAPAMNRTTRTAKLAMDSFGTLQGEVKEVRVGDRAVYQRGFMRNTAKDSDKIKSIEVMLASSLSSFHITKASVTNLKQNDLPLEFNYSLAAANYAKAAGNLLLLRPRVLGNRSSDLLETKEPRKFPVEFEGPSQDVDIFEIALPAGYEVDDMPPPVNVDFGFASYHSKTEATQNTLKYTRTVEIKELTVPLSKVEDLKKFYRIIASDERNNAVLKPVAH